MIRGITVMVSGFARLMVDSGLLSVGLYLTVEHMAGCIPRVSGVGEGGRAHVRRRGLRIVCACTIEDWLSSCRTLETWLVVDHGSAIAGGSRTLNKRLLIQSCY